MESKYYRRYKWRKDPFKKEKNVEQEILIPYTTQLKKSN